MDGRPGQFRERGLRNAEDKTAEEIEIKELKKAGLEVPGKIEQAVKHFFGIRAIKLAERKGGREGKKAGKEIIAEKLSVGPKLLDKLELYLTISPAATGVNLEPSEEQQHLYHYTETDIGPLCQIVKEVQNLGLDPIAAAFLIKKASQEDFTKLVNRAHRY